LVAGRGKVLHPKGKGMREKTVPQVRALRGGGEDQDGPRKKGKCIHETSIRKNPSEAKKGASCGPAKGKSPEGHLIKSGVLKGQAVQGAGDKKSVGRPSSKRGEGEKKAPWRRGGKKEGGCLRKQGTSQKKESGKSHGKEKGEMFNLGKWH